MDFETWSDRIFDEVVGKGTPDVPFYLYVDRAVLGRAVSLPDDEALEDFCAAYRQSFGSRRPFAEACQRAIRWSAQGMIGPPPMTAALAMTVLAVTERPIGAPHALYARQNELLGFEPKPAPPPGYPDDVPQMWQIWNKWLESSGNWVGQPTARPNRLANQGWARSQGLVRHSDRQLMKAWFVAAGLRPGENITGSRLAAHFAPWLLWRGSRGYRLRAIIGDNLVRDLLAEIVQQELAAWNGTLIVASTARVLNGSVAFDAFQNRLFLAVELTADQALMCAAEDDFPEAQTGTNMLGVPDGRWLLNDGCTLALAPGLQVRAGGRRAYLLADNPSASAYIQVRESQPQTIYAALVRDDLLDQALDVLGRAGADSIRHAAGPVQGWARLTRVVMVGPLHDEVGLFALGDQRPRAESSIQLIGGLRVGPSSYLCDQPPDVRASSAVREVRTLEVDGIPHRLGPEVTDFALGPLILDPGAHLIRMDGQSMAITLVSHVNEAARGSTAGFPLLSEGSRKIIGAFDADAGRFDHALTGALLRDGLSLGRPLVAWVGERAVLHVLTDEGVIYPITRIAPRWLRRISLPSDYVDAQEVTASVPGKPAFLLIRQAPGGRLRTVEIPQDGRDVRPESGGWIPVSPVVATGLVTELSAALPEGRHRLRGALNRALQGLAVAHDIAPIRRSVRQLSAAIPPGDEWAESHLDSPYDDLLTWLSEREGGSAPWKRLRETWDWLTREGSPDDDRGWLVQYQLEILGHVESDHVHQRTIVAPAAAVRLSRAGGYAVLCGSRPPEMVRRLMNAEDDADPLVQEGGAHWFVNAKAQRSPDGRDVGPAALYLEWASEHDALVERGLAALGIAVTWRTGERLMDALPTLEESLLSAPQRTMRPSPVFDRWCLRQDGNYDWVSVAFDDDPGLYRYEVFGLPRYAWRAEVGEPLRIVDHRAGRYLQLKRDAVQRILYHVPIGGWLLVPRSSPLPPLVARALVLRTGQVPLPLTLPAGPEWRFPHGRALAYPNVDSAMAERVERYLGLELSLIMNSPEELS